MELYTEEYLKASSIMKESSKEINDKYKEWKRAVETSLDPKTVELISLGASIALRCSYCIDSHSQKARARGATEKEIAAAVNIGAGIAAGAALSYGVLAFENKK